MKNSLAAGCVVMVLALFSSAILEAEDKVMKLVIVKAEYGDLPDGTKSDVTEKCKAAATANGLTIEASNDNFGDPVEGTTKKLKVQYTLDGTAMDMTANEGETLSIATKVSKLKIIKAHYGDLPDGAKTDVTVKVQEMVKDDALSVEATNEHFGDPVDGTVKKLKIEYSYDGGPAKTKEVEENSTLTISNKGE